MSSSGSLHGVPRNFKMNFTIKHIREQFEKNTLVLKEVCCESFCLFSMLRMCCVCCQPFCPWENSLSINKNTWETTFPLLSFKSLKKLLRKVKVTRPPNFDLLLIKLLITFKQFHFLLTIHFYCSSFLNSGQENTALLHITQRHQVARAGSWTLVDVTHLVSGTCRAN